MSGISGRNVRSADNLRSRGKTWRLAVTSLASCLLDSGALEGAPEVTWFSAVMCGLSKRLGPKLPEQLRTMSKIL